MEAPELSPPNRAALETVRTHRRRTRRRLRIAWTLVPLGILLVALPFLGIALLSPAWMDRLFPPWLLPAYLLVGFACLLGGSAVGLVLLVRGPGYRRTERLIAAAEALGFRFAFQAREQVWVDRAQALDCWPRHPKSGRFSVAGLLLREQAGVPAALLEPCTLVDPTALTQEYTPLLFPLRQQRIFALVPLPADFSGPTPPEENGERIEIGDGWLALAVSGDLADPAQGKRVLERALRLRDTAAGA